jgi:hypothetical protein
VLDDSGPSLFDDPTAVLVEGAEFWDEEHFELFRALADQPETRGLVLKVVNENVWNLPLDHVCEIWHLAR